MLGGKQMSRERYRALQHPVALPSPDQILDRALTMLMANGLITPDRADLFRKVKHSKYGLFLPIPACPQQPDLNRFMGLIEVNGKKGKCSLGSKDLTDKVQIPTGDYLLLNINDGRGYLNVKPSESERRILSEYCYPYTVWEGIIHAFLLPEVFMDLDRMWLCDTRYGSGGVPCLYISDGGPRLRADVLYQAHPRCGVRRHAGAARAFSAFRGEPAAAAPFFL